MASTKDTAGLDRPETAREKDQRAVRRHRVNLESAFAVYEREQERGTAPKAVEALERVQGEAQQIIDRLRASLGEAV
jgi:hypothetical protein